MSNTLILKKWSGLVLGLSVDAGKTIKNKDGKSVTKPSSISFALVNDFFGTYPIIKNKPHLRFEIYLNEYVISNIPDFKPILYRICLVENKECFENLIKTIKSSAYSPDIIIGATDINFRIAVISNTGNLQNKSFLIKDAENVCNFLIKEITINKINLIIK